MTLIISQNRFLYSFIVICDIALKQKVIPVWHLSPCHPGVHEHLFGPVHNP